MLFCSCCGKKLSHVDRTTEVRQEEAEHQVMVSEWIDNGCFGKKPPNVVDRSEHYICENPECRAGGCTFNQHHPFSLGTLGL